MSETKCPKIHHFCDAFIDNKCLFDKCYTPISTGKHESVYAWRDLDFLLFAYHRPEIYKMLKEMGFECSKDCTLSSLYFFDKDRNRLDVRRDFCAPNTPEFYSFSFDKIDPKMLRFQLERIFYGCGFPMEDEK